MTIWLIPIAFVAALCAIFAILRRAVPVMIIASCGLFALAGYGLTGAPGLSGKPVAAKPPLRQDFDPSQASEALMFVDRFAPSSRMMAMADSFARQGDFKMAAGLLTSAARQYPKDAEIWVMLGRVLAAHAKTEAAPAAQMAFRQAEIINPETPSLLYMRGVEAVQRNDMPAAEKAWGTLLNTGQKSASWRADIEKLLALVRENQAKAKTPVASPR
jgi:cytochrome c-type biogenesis protein CcmH